MVMDVLTLTGMGAKCPACTPCACPPASGSKPSASVGAAVLADMTQPPVFSQVAVFGSVHYEVNGIWFSPTQLGADVPRNFSWSPSFVIYVPIKQPFRAFAQAQIQVTANGDVMLSMAGSSVVVPYASIVEAGSLCVLFQSVNVQLLTSYSSPTLEIAISSGGTSQCYFS